MWEKTAGVSSKVAYVLEELCVGPHPPQLVVVMWNLAIRITKFWENGVKVKQILESYYICKFVFAYLLTWKASSCLLYLQISIRVSFYPRMIVSTMLTYLHTCLFTYLLTHRLTHIQIAYFPTFMLKHFWIISSNAPNRLLVSLLMTILV